MSKQVVVIGGGAAGMMAAYSAAKEGHQVILLEKNGKLGKKIYITGKGRCNITNASDIEDILNHIVSNYTFMYSSLYGFTNQDVVQLLEKNGCPTKVERGNRVFPVSDHANDVTAALTRALNKRKVEIRLGCTVTKIYCNNKGDCCQGLEYMDEHGKKKSLNADCVIVATGGLSYPSTGSTGDGYIFAKKTGHSIVPTSPALVAMNAKEDYCKKMQGLALKNIEASFLYEGKCFYKEQGEMLFTHFGVSGPVVLSASSYVTRTMDPAKIKMEIDLKPALDLKQLDQRILRDFKEVENKDFLHALDKLLPKTMIPIVIEVSGIDPHKKVHQVTKEEREHLLNLLKKFPVSIASLREYSEAIITKGGIELKEIDPGTMESKKVKGLRFAGEVLDLDAVTGGYNLQIAWSTGYAAGLDI